MTSAALGVVALLVCGPALAGGIDVLLWSAPFAVLLLPLMLGRYTGERVLHAARSRRRSRRVHRTVAAPLGALRGDARTRVRSGRVMAYRLAVRGPPRGALPA